MTGTVRAASVLNAIRRMPQLLSKGEVESLEERKKDELVFHDKDRRDGKDEGSREGNRRFYRAADPVAAQLDLVLAKYAGGAVVLDYACGNGSQIARYLRHGAAAVVAIDISPVSVATAARRTSAEASAGRCVVVQRDCEATGFPADSFDLVLCLGVLHHLDLSRALAECQRLLVPGGRLIAVEALRYNPLIHLYRMLTPQYRTDWERKHILSKGRLSRALGTLEVEEEHCLLMLSPLGAIVPGERLQATAIGVLHAVDEWLCRVPGVRWLAWQAIWVLRKPAVDQV